MLDCGKEVDNRLFQQWRWLGTFIAWSATEILGHEMIYNAAFVHGRAFLLSPIMPILNIDNKHIH